MDNNPTLKRGGAGETFLEPKTEVRNSTAICSLYGTGATLLCVPKMADVQVSVFFLLVSTSPPMLAKLEMRCQACALHRARTCLVQHHLCKTTRAKLAYYTASPGAIPADIAGRTKSKRQHTMHLLIRVRIILPRQAQYPPTWRGEKMQLLLR